MFVRCWGSSPLTRGKPGWQSFCHVNYGLIPAHAGKTVDNASATPACWAHPRSRGENIHTDEHVALGQGSSPLTRGKHATHVLQSLPQGLIPAHAGKTTCPPESSADTWAHPRSRGENEGSKIAW